MREALLFLGETLLDVGVMACLCEAVFWESRLRTAFKRKDRPELHKALIFFGIAWMKEITFLLVLIAFY